MHGGDIPNTGSRIYMVIFCTRAHKAGGNIGHNGGGNVGSVANTKQGKHSQPAAISLCEQTIGQRKIEYKGKDNIHGMDLPSYRLQ